MKTLQEYINFWSNQYPPKSSDHWEERFIQDLRTSTGAGKHQCLEAARIEDWNFFQCVERLAGRRPEEWRLITDRLQEQLNELRDKLEII